MNLELSPAMAYPPPPPSSRPGNTNTNSLRDHKSLQTVFGACKGNWKLQEPCRTLVSLQESAMAAPLQRVQGQHHLEEFLQPQGRSWMVLGSRAVNQVINSGSKQVTPGHKQSLKTEFYSIKPIKLYYYHFFIITSFFGMMHVFRSVFTHRKKILPPPGAWHEVP